MSRAITPSAQIYTTGQLKQPMPRSTDDRSTAQAPRSHRAPTRIWYDAKETGNQIGDFSTNIPRVYLPIPFQRSEASTSAQEPPTLKQVKHAAKQIAKQLSAELGTPIAWDDSRVSAILNDRLGA